VSPGRHKNRALDRATGRVLAALLCVTISPIVQMHPRVARADEPTSPSEPGSSSVAESPKMPESPAATTPMNADAKAYYDRGLTFFANHQFAAAIREFELGFALHPRPEFLFAEAQAFRLEGDCSRAVPLYRQFLDSNPTSIQIQATRLALGRCGPERSVSATPTLSPPAVRTPPVNATERPRWWKDPWALSSIGVGGAALAVGVGFAVASNQTRDEATSARTTNYFEFTRLWNEAGQRRTIAIASLIGGAALVAVGVVRLVFRTTVSPAVLSFHAGPGGGAVIWEVGY
jgi:hypothetical protein